NGPKTSMGTAVSHRRSLPQGRVDVGHRGYLRARDFLARLRAAGAAVLVRAARPPASAERPGYSLATLFLSGKRSAKPSRTRGPAAPSRPPAPNARAEAAVSLNDSRRLHASPR